MLTRRAGPTVSARPVSARPVSARPVSARLVSAPFVSVCLVLAGCSPATDRDGDKQDAASPSSTTSSTAPSASDDVPTVAATPTPAPHPRSEEHTSELQSLMRNSYAVFCLKKKNNKKQSRTKRN